LNSSDAAAAAVSDVQKVRRHKSNAVYQAEMCSISGNCRHHYRRIVDVADEIVVSKIDVVISIKDKTYVQVRHHRVGPDTIETAGNI
jgi:hypothetical protein